jgi:hypothetical protein
MVNNKINGGGSYFDFNWMFKPSENNGSTSTQVNGEEKKSPFSWLSWGAKPTDQPDQSDKQLLAQPTRLGGSKRKTKKSKKAKKSKTSKSKK